MNSNQPTNQSNISGDELIGWALLDPSCRKKTDHFYLVKPNEFSIYKNLQGNGKSKHN